MGIEIERKFLVRNGDWRSLGAASEFRQGYLSTDPHRTVRVRIAGEGAWLTVKGIARGAVRVEHEYQIPVSDGIDLLQMCIPPIIEKTRTVIEHEGFVWEVDEFAGANRGLVLAEVELDTEDQEVPLPDWVGTEVTGDARYFNANLVARPFSEWER